MEDWERMRVCGYVGLYAGVLGGCVRGVALREGKAAGEFSNLNSFPGAVNG